MPWAPSSTLPGVPPHTSQGIGSALDLSSGVCVPVRAGALCLAVEAGYSFPDRSRAEVTPRRKKVLRPQLPAVQHSSSRNLVPLCNPRSPISDAVLRRSQMVHTRLQGTSRYMYTILPNV